MALLQNFLALLVLSVTSNVTANMLLKSSVTKTGGVVADSGKLIDSLLKVGLNPLTLIGLMLYGFSFVIWLRVLTFNDLSRAYPIFVAFVFLFTTVGSSVFFKENVSTTRIIGLVIMVIGIFVVARS